MALEAWGSLPHRPGFIGHWRIQLGTFGEWFAALATAAAVGVAFYIAWKDRHDRISERHDEQKTHARLVQLLVDGGSNSRAAVTVEARNFGPLPVIDIDLVDAMWSEHPEARWVPLDSHWQARGLTANSTHRPILMPSQGVEDTFDTLAHFVIRFMHPTEERPLAPIEPRTADYPIPSYMRTDVSSVVAKVQFTTADGVRWETPTKGSGSGEPVRL